VWSSITPTTTASPALRVLCRSARCPVTQSGRERKLRDSKASTCNSAPASVHSCRRVVCLGAETPAARGGPSTTDPRLPTSPTQDAQPFRACTYGPPRSGLHAVGHSSLTAHFPLEAGPLYTVHYARRQDT
jgi:hypothetical protein